MTKYIAFQMYKGIVHLDPMIPFTGLFNTKEEAREYCHTMGEQAILDWKEYTWTKNLDGYWVHEKGKSWEDYRWAMTFDAIEEAKS